MRVRRPWASLLLACPWAVWGCAAFAEDALQLRWRHSGAPAAGLDVALHSGSRVVRGHSDAAGRVAAPAGFDVAHVVDVAHDYSVDLLPEALHGSVLEVPEPVRLRGRIQSATAGAALRLRIGAGRRWAVMERHRGAERRGDFAPAPGENTVFGIELPPVSVLWIEQALEGGGTFATEALSSANAVQLVAFDDAGGFVTLDVPIPPDVAAGQTLDCGTLRIPAPSAVDVELDVPQDHDITAMATLRAPVFDPQRRAEIARHLSVLDQFDEEVFEFATGRGPLLLDLRRPTRIAGLPRYAAMDLVVFGPLARMSVRRTVALKGNGPARVRFSASDLGLGAGAAGVLQRGQVVLEGTRTPVAGARVVYADYPAAQEATTDADGRFAMPQAGERRSARWFVDAGHSGVPEGYATTADVAAGPGGDEVLLELPKSPAGPPTPAPAPSTPAKVALGGGGDCTQNGQYPACQGEIQVGPTSWVLASVEGCVSNAPNTLTATVSKPGTWKFLYSDTPFRIGFSEPGTFTSSSLTKTVPMSAAGPDATMYVTFYPPPPAVLPARNLPFQISSWLLDPDSMEGTTPNTESAQVQIKCVNAGPLYFYVRQRNGAYIYWYDGVPITFGDTMVITLNRTPVSSQAQGWRAWSRSGARWACSSAQMRGLRVERAATRQAGGNRHGRTADGRLSVH